MRSEVLRVTGMTCGGCVSNVTHALKAVRGVGEVNVSLGAGTATVQYDERETSPVDLSVAVTGAGFGVDVTDTPHSLASKGCCCG